MDRSQMARNLYKARRMRTAEEVGRFEEARQALFSRGDPSVLNALFAAFDDTTEQHEVMWGLVHDAESFQREVYVREMVMATPQMLPHAKEWALLLHQRVLNSDAALAVYRDILRALPKESKEIVSGLLEEIGRSKLKLRERVSAVLNEMNTPA